MALENIVEIMRSVEFLSMCSEDQLRLLAFASEQKRYVAGDLLAKKSRDSEGAFIINSGTVIIGDDEELNEVSYSVSGPGALVGARSLFLQRTQRTSVIAASEVEALFVPRKAFVKLMQQYPEVAAKVAKRIEGELDNYLRALDGLRGQKSS